MASNVSEQMKTHRILCDQRQRSTHSSWTRRQIITTGIRLVSALAAFPVVRLVVSPSQVQADVLKKIGAVVVTYPYKPHYSMLIRHSLCNNCGKCVEACRRTNSVPDYGYRTAVLHKKGNGAAAAREYLPVMCNQCNDPPCVKACPTKALGKDAENGIVRVEEKLCTGCRTCMAVCPYDALYFNETVHAVDKCDFCYRARLSQGISPPACVEICPRKVFSFGDIGDKGGDFYHTFYSQDENISVLKPEKGTMPNVFYLT